MSDVKPKYSKEEFSRRGEAIYEPEVRPHLKPGDDAKLVAIDIESGLWELGTDELEVVDRLRRRAREAQIWMRRAGKDKAVNHFRSPRRVTDVRNELITVRNLWTGAAEWAIDVA